jgi:hypothetical protein
MARSTLRKRSICSGACGRMGHIPDEAKEKIKKYKVTELGIVF